MLFALLPPLVIADLGAGEGTVAQLLARRAKEVICFPPALLISENRIVEKVHASEYDFAVMLVPCRG